MKRYLIFLFILKLTTHFAQNGKDALEKDVKTLTANLTQNQPNDSLKVVAIYNWITSNIRYDNHFRRRLDGDTTLTQEPNFIIKSKKAVCIGFSKLLKEMCSFAQTQSVVIEGFAKSNGYNVDKEEHAWNAVKINEKWYHLDATWGITSAVYAKKYLFTDPSVFAETHLPHDPLWQLLDYPLSIDCFVNGRDCSNGAFFNIKDSLNTWESLDLAARVYNEALRTVQYNPKDIRALKHLGEYSMSKALKLYQQYFKLKNTLKRTKNKQEAYALLDATILKLKEAKAHYQRITPLVKTKNYTDAQMNIDVIDENLSIIEEEKTNIEKEFK